MFERRLKRMSRKNFIRETFDVAHVRVQASVFS
jgi:hypothetical protein